MDGQIIQPSTDVVPQRKWCIFCGLYISSLLIACIEITASLGFFVFYIVSLLALPPIESNANGNLQRASFYITICCLQFCSAVFAGLLVVCTFMRVRSSIRIWCYYTAVSTACDLLLLILIWIWDGTFPFQVVYTILRIYFVYLVWNFYKELRAAGQVVRCYSRTELVGLSSLLNMAPQYQKNKVGLVTATIGPHDLLI